MQLRQDVYKRQILNTLYVILLTLLIVLPLGVGAAVYLTEYASNRKLIEVIEFTN